MKSKLIVTTALSLLVVACVTNKKILRSVEESRGPDARRGVLSESLNSEQRARVELLGRTSAPTRYAERTDANRIRVVAINFGGVMLGQCADPSGNLLDGLCNTQKTKISNPEQVLALGKDLDPTARKQLDAKVEELKTADEKRRTAIQEEIRIIYEQIQENKDAGKLRLAPTLHAGMFRQFSTQVGTTIETDLSIGPVGNTTRFYHSRNFLVLEWRRYYEESLAQPAEQLGGYVHEIRQLGEQLATLDATVAAQVQAVATSIEADRASIVKQIDELAKVLVVLQAAATTVQNDIGKLEKQVEDSRGAMRQAREKELSEKNKLVTGLQGQVEQLRTTIAKIESYATWLDIHGMDSTQNYVSAVEKGIAVRIIFDVQLRTADSDVSASFGIANLSAALARNEATVEVSYEVTGTSIDPLPREAIIITSVNEYLEAFKRFHGAVALISEAWEVYSTWPSADAPIVELPGSDGKPKELEISDHHFALAQLSYYVHGPGIGDNFVLTKNAEMCQDMQVVDDFLQQELLRKRKQMDAIDCHRNSMVKKGKSGQQRGELEALGKELDYLIVRYDDIRTRMAENACQRACQAEERRLEYVCDGTTGNVACVSMNESDSLLRRCASKVDDFTVPTKTSCTQKDETDEPETTDNGGSSPNGAGEPPASGNSGSANHPRPVGQP